jgi:hypothetical protein
MKSLLAALLAFAAAHASQPAKPFAAALKPGGIHEECLRLEKGEKRAYLWKSDAPVDFNVHYHRGDDVFFPVKRDRALTGDGTFVAPSREDYCWMWTALDKPAKVEGAIR